ncbi:MAG: MarR family winged helix-turn-helix transcriptional regulator [Phycisphaerae bacterium]
MSRVDGLLKAMLVFARTSEEVLQGRHVVVDGEPLSRSKVQVLRLLARRPSQSSTQIARFLGVSKPAVTQIVDAMVRSRLVTRRTSRVDRRGVDLKLSATGRQVFGKIRHEQRHLIRTAARSISERDVDRWIRAMAQAASALAQADRSFERFCLQCGAHADGSCILVGGEADCLFLKHHGKKLASKKPKAPPPRRPRR